MFRRLSSIPSLEVLGDVSRLVGPLREGDLLGVIATDQLAYSYALSTAVESVGRAYYMDVSSRIPPVSGEVLFGRVYSMEEVLSGLDYVEDGSLVVVGSLNVLEPSKGDILKVKRIADRKGLYMMFVVEEPSLNELDLLSEAKRLFIVPEVFEQLLVLRISYYRGKYRLSLSVLRTYPDNLRALGEHEIQIKEEALFPSRGGQPQE
ncbi:hypothetical protein QDY65_06440 [Pyrococcus kukulkanii]|uniref:Recombinase RecA n=1 Tax=Pyrococcus kukulkanii TaxID=1609559 RepID=A0A127B8E7_9EURY|nr:hypothetical protein [Pyrococcus kukulkanii]AMM53069.1 hypothetical protein TQ32_00115 [Pyrococcus kukulkanii]